MLSVIFFLLFHHYLEQLHRNFCIRYIFHLVQLLKRNDVDSIEANDNIENKNS